MNGIPGQTAKDVIKSAFDTIGPVQITLQGRDSYDVISGVMLLVSDGKKEVALELFMALGVSCRMLGIEDGVDAVLGTMREHIKNVPLFMKPLLIHCMSHIITKGKEAGLGGL